MSYIQIEFCILLHLQCFAKADLHLGQEYGLVKIAVAYELIVTTYVHSAI